ncbi:GDP-mannose 4,6-dehydratase, partial [Tenacibaculum finnmarkense]|uniref:GDP-mannose 4,6-dehydratase n=1 Tax=Tenacibaculum finnmarkense TaxID=2781243 RepID=UPI001EFB5DDE
DEKGYDGDSDRVLIEVDPIYFRPTEVEQLLGDPSKAADKLGWTATIGFKDLVEEMVTQDVKLLKSERLARRTYGVVE